MQYAMSALRRFRVLLEREPEWKQRYYLTGACLYSWKKANIRLLVFHTHHGYYVRSCRKK